MATLNDLVVLKSQVEKLQQASDRAKGALDQAMRRLKTEFGCDSLPAALKKLRGLEEEEQTAKRAFEEAVSQFKKDHADVL